jgi:hypothetical protein
MVRQSPLQGFKDAGRGRLARAGKVLTKSKMRGKQPREQIACAMWLDRKLGRCDAAENAAVADNRFDAPRGRIVKRAAGEHQGDRVKNCVTKG